MKQILNQSKDINLNYAAKICRVDAIKPLKNADNLVYAVLGNDKIIVSKDMKVGDIVVYFPLECAISEKYLSKNNLYSINCWRKNDLAVTFPQADDSPEWKSKIKPYCGFFDENGRVRCLKLREEYSMGYVAPVETLEHVWPALRSEIWSKDLGYQFDMIGKDRICWKYRPIKKINTTNSQHNYKHRMKKIKKFDRIIPGQFRFHYDTLKLVDNIWSFNPEDVVDVTVKVHGTSTILANVLTKRPLSTWEKIKKFFGSRVKETEYGNIYASRSVIKNEYINPNQKHTFYETDPWGCVDRDFHEFLAPGMTVYGEIVGYQEGKGSYIQKDHDYGCKKGCWKFMPYRITMTDKNGRVVQEFNIDGVMNWISTVHESCSNYKPELKDKILPIDRIYHGPIGEMYGNLYTHIALGTTEKEYLDTKKEYIASDNYSGFLPTRLESYNEYIKDKWRTALIQAIENDTKNFEILEPLCKNKVPREGFVFRKSDDPESKAFKIKTKGHFAFEGKQLDKGETDIESDN